MAILDIRFDIEPVRIDQIKFDSSDELIEWGEEGVYLLTPTECVCLAA